MFAAVRATRTVACTRAFSSTPRAALARMNLIGRLGNAPEEVPLQNEKTLVKFVVASSYGRGENEKTSWFRAVSFAEGKQKDYLMNVPKGSLIHIDADARMETYTDGEGKPRSSLSLLVRSLDVLSRPYAAQHPETNEEGIVQEEHHRR